MGSLAVLRCGFVLSLLGLAVVAPGHLEAPARELIQGSAAYLTLLLAPWVLARQPKRRAQRIIGATLLLDGVYLTWVTYATGGTQSPLRFLIVIDVVAVTLLASWRTGLKIAGWYSLLLFVVLYAQASAILPVREGLVSALPGHADFLEVSLLQVGALWLVAIATAAFAAVNERELRSQKVHLQELSDMVREMDRGRPVAEIPDLLLGSLCAAFGFPRGVVLISLEGEPSVAATRGIQGHAPAPGLDRIVERAWEQQRTQLARALDAGEDPRLAELLPAANNVLVVPLMDERGGRIGAIAVEHPARRPRIKRWVLRMVEQFASHAALTLRSAWLRERLEHQLEENRALQHQLAAHNLELEETVAERTADLRRSLHELGEAHEQRRRLLAHLVHAEEEERKRIAGDVHDDPVQKMVAASMWIQVLRRTLRDDEQLSAAEKVLASVRGSIDSLRHMIFELRPEILDREGLAPALREYLDSLEAGFEVRVEDRLKEEPPPEVRVVLYRMAQEALANVAKHAGAGRVAVRLARRDGGYLVRIVDDGVGFVVDPAARSARGHLGLSSMRERAELAGGSFRVESAPGSGTTVELWLPGRTRPGALDGPERLETAASPPRVEQPVR